MCGRVCCRNPASDDSALIEVVVSRIPERKAPDLEVAAVTTLPRALAGRMEMTRRKGMSALEKDTSSAA